MTTAPGPFGGYIPQLPEGWVKCPKFGDPRFFDGLNIIPCKVPLSTKFNNLVGPSGRWTLVDAIRQFRSYGMDVATIIDLTKSRNYYDINREMEELDNPDIHYVKIACRGRGQSPLPSEVNEAVWHIFSHHMNTRDKYILLHCTHGFNRTGYVVVAALMRLRYLTVKRAVIRFAQSRPPGIYKDGYLNDLFTYYHEERPPRQQAYWGQFCFLYTLSMAAPSLVHVPKLSPTPPVPSWKGNDNAEDAADAANEDQEGEVKGSAAEALLTQILKITLHTEVHTHEQERYRAIDTDVVGPRNLERQYIDRWRNVPFDPARAEYDAPPLAYDYTAERFSVRRKEFWPVFQIDKVFARFNDPHNIGHESDGLILQGYEDLYVTGTCERLYKWKFAHMNSVDFQLRCAKRIGPSGQPELDPNGQPEPLQLFLLDQNASRGRGIAYIPLAKVDKDGG
ncbi:hypothetical protein VOLCADRAFT_118228 [Volvox carteri f. nagariensis]|uniref:Tyrosine specific protein phosphatases domain-containing protein n=1 Tax=Volvox carteri f. nagariensis TaxID=3068 RepID=D8U2T8_VOLCA|nr:uncharacterized protein VOLCADRAFT_118228 [Volvox carteri f. nagariensis]EFJ45861.1 hypothetical protein VOLCADRAFT_118228 [Volvox carteri f. nagariensis]|eukprot:XP_002952939.1 hypothetical protein VOLCADRAFT_118228 [Volvox carteri f. nagariensis]